MDINVNIKKNNRFRAFYLFFLIASIQIGVGIIGAPRYIYSFAGHDAWFSVLLAYGFMILTILVMFIILQQYKNTDIFGIQVDIFGVVIGKLLGCVYIIYFGLTLVSILSTYAEIVRVYLYPILPIYVAGLFILSLAIYAIFGGIRVVVGACFLFFILSQFILLLLYDPVARIEWGNFLPLFQAKPSALLEGARATTYTFVGFELLFVLYPFVDNKEKAKMPVFLGLTYTMLIVLATIFILIGYFSLEYIEQLEWPLLTLFKSVSFTFVERIDYLVVIEWMMIVLPNNILFLWAMTYGAKRLFSIKQKYSTLVFAGILLIATGFLTRDYAILKLTDIVAKLGFWIGFIYPFLLLPCVLIKKWWNKSKGWNSS